jgi:hypothetical protein
MTDKPKLTVVGNSTGTNTGTKTAKQSRGKPYKGQPKAGSVKTPVNSEGLTVKQEAFCMPSSMAKDGAMHTARHTMPKTWHQQQSIAKHTHSQQTPR